MKSTTWLASLSVTLGVFAAGHTAGTAIPRPPRGAREAFVMHAMQGTRLPMMGFERSYWDFYYGFALVISVLMVVMAAIAWQVRGVARTDPSRALAMTVTLGAGCLGLLLLSVAFFFTGPIVLSALTVFCATMAAVSLGREARRAG